MSPTPTDLAHTPAASAPPGYTSNLEDPVTKSTTPGIVLAIVGMIISTGFLAMRIYTKAVLARIFGVDDVLLILAWILALFVQISIVIYMSDGIIGPHVWDISVEDLKKLVFITAVDAAIYIVVLALAKVSILLFYLKFARERWFTIAVWSTIGFIIAFSIALFLSLVFACTPLKMVWDVTITDGHCINRGKNYLATAGLNASTDIIMLLLPMPMLWKLQVKPVQKIGLACIFAIGSLTMVTSFIRLRLMRAMAKETDLSWKVATPATWVCIEGNLIVICGALPILRLFLRHVCPRLIGEYGTNKSATGGRSKPENGSTELSSLERSKRSMRNRSHKDQYSTMETVVGVDEGSDTCIVERTGKAAIAVDITDLGYQNRDDSSLAQHAAPIPYSQARSTPPPRPVRSPPPPQQNGI